MHISRKDCAILVALLIMSSCFFYYVNSQIKPVNEWVELKYSTPDSTTYLNVGRWLMKKVDFDVVKSSLATRPFFYPLIVVSLELIHPWAILIFQFILWQIQILMIYIACIKISSLRVIALIIAIISIGIISPIAIALHALTETVSSFLITFSVFMLTLNLYKKSYLYHTIYLLSLSLCSVARPSVLYIYIYSLAVIVLSSKKINILYVLIFSTTAIPILIQVHGMKKYFDSYQLSFIDTVAINNYFLPGLELYKRNIEGDVNKNYYIRMNRDIRSRHMTEMIEKEGYDKTSKNIKKDFFGNLTSYPFETFRQFKDLALENSVQPSSFVTVKMLYIATLLQSRLLLTVNIISILFFLIIMLEKILKKVSVQDGYFLYTSLILFNIFFTYISTGVVFWQGDRFLVPIYYVSIILFVFQIKVFFYNTRQLRLYK